MKTYNTNPISLLAVAFLLSPYAAPAATVTYYTTEHYYGRTDSPFYAGIQAGTIYLEDFENLPFGSPRVSTPYISASAGHVATSAGVSVDEDDGSDGKWISGYSWLNGSGGGFRIQDVFPIWQKRRWPPTGIRGHGSSRFYHGFK